MNLRKMVGILGMAFSAMVSANAVIDTVELQDQTLIITGQNFVLDGTKASTVRFAGSGELLDCFVQSDRLECDIGAQEIIPGMVYRVEHAPADVDDFNNRMRFFKIDRIDLYVPIETGGESGGGMPYTQRLIAGNAQYVSAGEVVPFEFECAEGIPLMGNAAMNENSSINAWRIVDYDIDDCRYKANSCFIVKAEKLVTDNSQIYLRGIMTCQ